MIKIIKTRTSLLVAAIFLSVTVVNNCSAQDWNVRLLNSINPTHPDSKYWINTSRSAFYLPGALSFGGLIYGLSANDEAARRNSYELFLSIGVNALITEGLKISVNEERPADKYPKEIFTNSVSHGHSFPSGHTALAFTTATTVALEYHKWYITVPAYLWAGSVGYSRMYLGKHYPTDVFAGAVTGIGTGYLSHWLSKQIFKPYVQKKTYE
ncbi:MAG: phosphatase PAP2 family protein [Bacteroidota bacterium]|nr:phosphatase PAP2 family protein [Bacteroidota bacterium]